MPFTVAPLRDVKGENNYPEYVSALRSTQNRAYQRASEIWAGFTPGGLTPGDNQFGIRPLVANEMAKDVTVTTLSGTYNFRKNITATGWRDIFNYTVRKDIMHGFVGFGVAETIMNVNQIKMILGDRTFPILGLDEVQLYKSFGFVIKTDDGKELVCDPESAVQIRGYVTTTGWQTIMPLGFELYRRKDLVINEV